MKVKKRNEKVGWSQTRTGWRDEFWARAVDYLGDWFDKANAVISSFNLGQAVTEIVPVVFPAAQKCGPLFLVKLDTRVNRLISKQSL